MESDKTQPSLVEYYRRRAREYEAIYAKPERQRVAEFLGSLHARLEPGARVVIFDNRLVEYERP